MRSVVHMARASVVHGVRRLGADLTYTRDYENQGGLGPMASVVHVICWLGADPTVDGHLDRVWVQRRLACGDRRGTGGMSRDAPCHCGMRDTHVDQWGDTRFGSVDQWSARCTHVDPWEDTQCESVDQWSDSYLRGASGR